MRLYTTRPGGRRYRPVVGRLAVPMSGALALLGSAVLALGLGALGELRAGWFALGAFAGFCALLEAASRPGAAPLIGAAGWLFYNGFAVHRYAMLGWAGTGVELARLGLFMAAALLAALPAVLPRRRIRAERWVYQST